MSVATGETMRARWASTGAGASVARVAGDLFVVARGAHAELVVEVVAAITWDPASRSALPSPPADPLAALFHIADTRVRGSDVVVGALRVTPPWATIVLAGDAYAARQADDGVTPIVSHAPPLGRAGAFAVRYLPVARGQRLALCTAELTPRCFDPTEARCAELAGDTEAAVLLELL